MRCIALCNIDTGIIWVYVTVYKRRKQDVGRDSCRAWAVIIPRGKSSPVYVEELETFGSRYSLSSSELQTTDTELWQVSQITPSRAVEGTYESAIANEAHTGASLACPAGYTTPAAIGSATMLYTDAQNYHGHHHDQHPTHLTHRTQATLTKLNLTRLNTVLARSVSVSKLRRFDETRMNDALEIATSLPDPIAMPTSAAVSAGASLIPSPTIATTQRAFSRRRARSRESPRRGRFIPTCCSHWIFSACACAWPRRQ